jgi:hypothetical protein
MEYTEPIHLTYAAIHLRDAARCLEKAGQDGWAESLLKEADAADKIAAALRGAMFDRRDREKAGSERLIYDVLGERSNF